MIDPKYAERTYLGTLLAAEVDLPGAGSLPIESLELSSHRTLLQIIRAQHAATGTANCSTVASELTRANLSESIGGIGYLFSLTEGIPRGTDLGPHMAVIREAATTRRLRALLEDMETRIVAGEQTEELMADLQGEVLKLQTQNVKVRPAYIREFAVATWEAMQEQAEREAGKTLGIPTGIADFDRALGGWHLGELTYIGALPGRGKTALMVQAMHHAATHGHKAGCISLEMQAQQIMRRLGTIQSKLPAYKFRDPRLLTPAERRLAKDSLFALGELDIQICDQSGLDHNAITTLARQMHAKGAEVIFVDFVQIIHEDGRDRREAINRVSAALRDTAKALNIPFVVLSQLARRDSDPNRRPTIQDLRESGNLEQDAHNVALIYRPKHKETGEWTGEDELILDKSRENETGRIPVTYDADSLTFGPRRRGIVRVA